MLFQRKRRDLQENSARATACAFVDVHTEVASNGTPQGRERDENGFVMSHLPV
jgi:hypothetical protein